MAKASIHIEAVKTTSEKHNQRLIDYDYVRSELTPNNESWQIETISNARKRIEENYVKTTGQKMQKKAEPIREGVVLLGENHTMDDLHRLRKEIEKRFGIKTLQMYIHRDEGHWKAKEWKQNLHAHMVFDWTQENGKAIRLNRKDLSEMQDIVSEVLEMERGQKANITGKKHLKPIEFKLKQYLIQIEELEKRIHELKHTFDLGEEAISVVNKELEQKKAELSHKHAEFQSFLNSNVKVSDFYKVVKNGLFGTKKEINEEELASLISSFSFSTEENKKLTNKINYLSGQVSEQQNKIREKDKNIETLNSKIRDLNQYISNPPEEFLRKELRKIEDKNKAEEERKKLLEEYNQKLPKAIEIAVRNSIKYAQENDTRLDYSDIEYEFKAVLEQNKIPNVWTIIQIHDKINEELDKYNINLGRGGVRFRR